MRDNQLIFMISMPRSGSTMLQKIIGAHSQIYTRSEPWLMLHPLHALKSSDIQTRFNAKLAEGGVRDFISGLPKDGLGYYYKRIQSCYLGLYNQYLKSSQKTHFLDKTPRYYEIFDELQLTFPKAKFIIIYRNPLAVLSSILETWVKGNYKNLIAYKADLEQGPEFLLRDFSQYENTHLVRYENLLKQPQNTVKKLFDFLQLDFEPDCINYGKAPTEKWLYGDLQTVYEKGAPDTTHVDAWQAHLKDPVTCKLISDYLEKLGEARFNRLGYDYAEARQALDMARQDFSHPEILNTSLVDNMLSNAEKMEKTVERLIKESKGYSEAIKEKNQQIEKQLAALRQLKLEFMDLVAVSGFKHPLKKIRRYKKLLAIHRKILFS